MSQLIFCLKLKKEAEALPKAPFPNALGERIYQEISKEAWQLWLKHQTILINENRFNLTNPEDRAFLKQAMEKFFNFC
jgi:Fe-S cluster biosynthesis and repair protein YggX